MYRRTVGLSQQCCATLLSRYIAMPNPKSIDELVYPTSLRKNASFSTLAWIVNVGDLPARLPNRSLMHYDV